MADPSQDKKKRKGAFARRSVHKKAKDKAKENGASTPSTPRTPSTPAAAAALTDPAAAAAAAHAHAQPPTAYETFHQKLDGPLIHKGRSHSGRFPSPQPPRRLVKLPSLFDARDGQAREALLIQKLQSCCVVFNFEDPLSDVKSKEVKRETLNEICAYLSSGSCVPLTQGLYMETCRMFASNVLRVLPPPSVCNGAEFDPEEDEPLLEPSWPHLSLVYDVFFRFLEQPTYSAHVAKHYISEKFVLRLLHLFHSEDPRERDNLKSTLHRIYGKHLPLRSRIRRSIGHIFYRYLYETGKHNGIAELLEILGSIVNGFAVPLKHEHKLFLIKALMPLHKAKALALFHPQLQYCIVLYLDKDPSLTQLVVKALIKYWPKVNSHKQIMFLAEVEAILQEIDETEFVRVHEMLFRQLAKCMSSTHFQVAERSLLLFHQPRMAELMTAQIKTILPIVYPALHGSSKKHWNRGISALLLHAMRFLMERDEDLFHECNQAYQLEQERLNAQQLERDAHWQRLKERAEHSPLAEAGVAKAAVKGMTGVQEHGDSAASDTGCEADDVLTEQLQKAKIDEDFEKRRLTHGMRRKSFLPHDEETQRALMNYKAHALSVQNSSDDDDGAPEALDTGDDDGDDDVFSEPSAGTASVTGGDTGLGDAGAAATPPATLAHTNGNGSINGKHAAAAADSSGDSGDQAGGGSGTAV